MLPPSLFKFICHHDFELGDPVDIQPILVFYKRPSRVKGPVITHQIPVKKLISKQIGVNIRRGMTV